MQLLIANWKANKSAAAAKTWFAEFRSTLSELRPTAVEPKDRIVAIAPAFFLMPCVAEEITATAALVQELLGAKLVLGAQDVSHLGAGSYTGAVAAIHLPSMGVSHVIVGHSERRRYFHESHQEIAGKIDQVLDAGMTPVLCVDSEYAVEQINTLNHDWLSRIVFAYEPVSAIGSGNNISVEAVRREVEIIKTTAGDVPVLYGGSINDQNISEYLLVTSGGIIGTAAVEGKTFAEVLAAAW